MSEDFWFGLAMYLLGTFGGGALMLALAKWFGKR